MADATPLYSGLITDLNASPAVKHDPIDFKGVARSVVGVLALTSAVITAAAAGDTWAMVRVPSRARIKSVKLTSDQLDSSTGLAVSLGVYAANQAGVLANTSSDTLWLSAASTFQAAVLGVDQSLAIAASKQAQPLWQLIGLASDPSVDYDICFKVTHAATTAETSGSVALEVGFVDND